MHPCENSAAVTANADESRMASTTHFNSDYPIAFQGAQWMS